MLNQRWARFYAEAEFEDFETLMHPKKYNFKHTSKSKLDFCQFSVQWEIFDQAFFGSSKIGVFYRISLF